MYSQLGSDLEDMRTRLVALERENRRLKQLGIMGLVGITLLFAMGQAPGKKTVEANEFILTDSSGKVRARLGMNPKTGSTEMLLLDSKGQTRSELFAGDTKSGVVVFSSAGKPRLKFVADDSGSDFTLSDSEGLPRVLFGQNDHSSDADGGAFLYVESGRGIVRLTAGGVLVYDAEGFEAFLGTADLETAGTGEKHKTSAASLTLFGKDKNVIWRAP